MSRYTREDIIRIVEEEDVEFIRLQFTDLFGTLKNVAITASQLEKALHNRIMFDGSSIQGFVGIEESGYVSASGLRYLHHSSVASAAGKSSQTDLRYLPL